MFIELDSYDRSSLILTLPVREHELLRHFGQHFRMHYLLGILGDNTTEAINFSYDWSERLNNLIDSLCSIDQNLEIPRSLSRDRADITQEFFEKISGHNLSPLCDMTFHDIGSQYTIGFASCFMKPFYCGTCGEMENTAGLMHPGIAVIRGSGESVKRIRDYYINNGIKAGSITTSSCPYCKPLEFELSSWKRLLYRRPNICTCVACGRY